MEIVQLLHNTHADADGQAKPIGDFRLINGPIAFLIYGPNINATINIQGTIATQDEVNDGTANWVTVEGGSFTEEKATALFVQFTHMRAQVDSYSAGTISVRMLL